MKKLQKIRYMLLKIHFMAIEESSHTFFASINLRENNILIPHYLLVSFPRWHNESRLNALSKAG